MAVPWALWRTPHLYFLECGPGPALAGAALAWALSQGGFASVLGIGIAGAFPGSGLEVGDAVWVAWESFADLGAEDGDEWLDFPALGLPGLPPENRFPLLLPAGCPGVGGTTASGATGSDATASRRRRRTGADVETMEGAAWALVCQRFGVPMSQARGISNLAGPRKRELWRIPDAFQKLSAALAEWECVG
jgi:futalosine hydrolase